LAEVILIATELYLAPQTYIVDILTSLYRKVKEMSQCVEINALYRNGAVMKCEKMPYEVIVVEV
jgi:hypothetical protein